jgi:uncharacterized phage protein (TIGR02218 family)
MRSATGALIAHLQQSVTTMALCFKIDRNDGQSFYFTGHDNDLLIGGNTYRSDISFSASQADVKSGLSVDNAELTLPLMTGGITKADVRANLFYRASLDVFWANWDDLTQGVLYEAKGWSLGKYRLKENSVVFEVRSLANKLNAPILDMITPDCPYTFGVDDGVRSFCPAGVYDSASSYEYSGTVTGASSSEPQRIFTDTGRTESSDIFKYGLVTWDTGNNAGYSMEVESFNPDTDSVTLLFNMPYDIEVGDTYTIWQGCDKQFDTCKAFGFQLDFGGEPNVPSQDLALQYKAR